MGVGSASWLILSLRVESEVFERSGNRVDLEAGNERVGQMLVSFFLLAESDKKISIQNTKIEISQPRHILPPVTFLYGHSSDHSVPRGGAIQVPFSFAHRLFWPRFAAPQKGSRGGRVKSSHALKHSSKLEVYSLDRASAVFIPFSLIWR